MTTLAPNRRPSPQRRLELLAAAFAVFNSLRIVAYLPTLLALHASGHTEQHSLFTWLVFLGANLTMALWLHEQNGRRMNRAIAVNACNALMCGAIALSIGWLRWMPPATNLLY
ncbi:hypothetical protein [Hydrogenophaga pseudoflava]|uniref:hypothetical protein n=1 Tax=Hydrogenophaga pseudoflava TaxID=47421 RepID=UPI0027E57017|nr:hypothetical protein [Hydrogenophaga pseudoflava]MDQ7743087.1 hypothetical protein [Hydrogenophaga pseudoflava]